MASTARNATFSASWYQQPSKPKKKRVRNFTATERAAHRTIERERREALNQRFMELARLIPALEPVRRLSKAAIVRESTLYLKNLRAMRLAATTDVRALLTERDALVNEVNYWRRRQLGPAQRLRENAPVPKSLQKLFTVEQEKFGTFEGGFTEGARGDDLEDEAVGDAGVDSSSSTHEPQSATAEPRRSVDGGVTTTYPSGGEMISAAIPATDEELFSDNLMSLPAQIPDGDLLPRFGGYESLDVLPDQTSGQSFANMPRLTPHMPGTIPGTLPTAHTGPGLSGQPNLAVDNFLVLMNTQIASSANGHAQDLAPFLTYNMMHDGPPLLSPHSFQTPVEGISFIETS